MTAINDAVRLKVRDVLVAARDRVATPKRWGKGRGPVPPGGKRECIATALYRAAYHLGFCETHRVSRRAHGRMHRAAHTRNIVEWNDAPERTHAEVLDAFDRAIKACGTESA